MKYKKPLKMTLHSTDDRTNDKKKYWKKYPCWKVDIQRTEIILHFEKALFQDEATFGE